MQKLTTTAIAAVAAIALGSSPAAASASAPALPLSAFSFDDVGDESGYIWFGEDESFFSSPAVKLVAGYAAIALLLVTIWGGNGRPVTP